MTQDLQDALDRARKFSDPTPEDLGLPNDPHALYVLEGWCSAPRAAWRDYYAAVGHFHDEANARQRMREVRTKAARRDRLRISAHS